MKSRLATYTFIIVSLLLAGAYVVTWIPTLSNPADAVNRDFTIFATAATIAREHGYGEIYSISRQIEAQTAIVGSPIQVKGGLLPFNHPPFLIPLLSLFFASTTSIYTAFLGWVVFNLLLFGFCLWLAYKILNQAGWRPDQTVLILVPLALIFPLQTNLFQGQDILFVLLGLLLFVRSLQTDNLLWGGLGLGLTTISPHLALIFCIPIFFSTRKRFFAFAAGGAFFAIVSIILIGMNGITDFLTMLSQTASAEAGTYGVFKDQMFTFSSLVFRLWPAIPATLLSTLTWVGYVGAILGLSWLHSSYKGATPNQLLYLTGFTISIGLFFAPHLYGHGLLPLFIPFLAWGHYAVIGQNRPAVHVGLCLLLASVLMLFNLVPAIPFHQFWTFVVLIGTIFLSASALKQSSKPHLT